MVDHVYNHNKGLDIMPWQLSMAEVYFEPVINMIKCKKTKLGRT